VAGESGPAGGVEKFCAKRSKEGTTMWERRDSSGKNCLAPRWGGGGCVKGKGGRNGLKGQNWVGAWGKRGTSEWKISGKNGGGTKTGWDIRLEILDVHGGGKKKKKGRKCVVGDGQSRGGGFEKKSSPLFQNGPPENPQGP